MGSEPGFAEAIPVGARTGYRESRCRRFAKHFPPGGAEAARRGRQLYRQLFGQLKPQEIQKPAWLFRWMGRCLTSLSLRWLRSRAATRSI